MSMAVSFSGRMEIVPGGRPTKEFEAVINALLNRTGGAVSEILASNVTNTPNGAIAAVNVQAALDELDAEKEASGTAAAAIVAHVALPDPHAQYATGAALTAHTGSTANPHSVTAAQVGAVAGNTAITGATKTKITYDAKGLVTAGADATTADVADSVDRRYLTDAERSDVQALGTLSTQDATGVAITGGAIDGAALGGTTPAAGAFTTVTATSYSKTNAVAVASLPSAVSAGVGARSFVTDASASTFNSVVAAGGANKVPVFSDGTQWLIG